MRTCVRVSIKGSSVARFRRALQTRNPTLVLAAAAELPRIELPDALAICLVLLDGGSPRYGRAAARWHARFCLECPELELGESALTLAALQTLAGPDGGPAAEALASLFMAREREDLARVVAAWAARRD